LVAVINGEEKRVPEGLTVRELIATFGLKPETAIVEKNGQIIERAHYASEKIRRGDVIEFVRFVGGG
jgi:thiamine biosynthesis protein ThiS